MQCSVLQIPSLAHLQGISLMLQMLKMSAGFDKVSVHCNITSYGPMYGVQKLNKLSELSCRLDRYTVLTGCKQAD